MIGSAIPHIIGLLCHRDPGIRRTGAELLQDISHRSEIHLIFDLNVVDEVIDLFYVVLQHIPEIIDLIGVNDSDSYGRYGGAEVLLGFSKRGKSLIFWSECC